MTESRAGRFDIGREFRFVEGFFGGWVVFFGNNVVDGLLHLFFFYSFEKNITDQRDFHL